MQTVLLVLVGLAVLATTSPALIKLAAAFVPLVVVITVALAALRIVWFYARS